MTFLPTFVDWQAIELVGYGGYGRVYRCNRKDKETSTNHQEDGSNNNNNNDNDTNNANTDEIQLIAHNNESSLSPIWYPKTVAIKMIQYVREPTKDKDQRLNWQQIAALFGRNHNHGNNNNNNQHAVGAGIGDLITNGLEGLKEAAALLSTGTHPCTIRLDSCFYSIKYKSLCLVEEWADGPTLGDIYSLVGALSEKAMTAVVLDMLHGLLHLHSCRMIHRDIKPTNILTNTRTGLSKICDLGVSALRPEIGDYRKTYCGTAGFLAPEVAARNPQNNDGSNNNRTNNNNDNNDNGENGIFDENQQRIERLANLQQAWGPMSSRSSNHLANSGQGYNEAADLWSMGITLLEGAIGQVQAHQFVAKIFNCFTVEEEASVRRAVQMGLPAPRNHDDFYHVARKQMETKMLGVFNVGPELTDLLLSMLDPIPSRRPTCHWLLTKHPFCVKALKTLCGEDEIDLPTDQRNSTTAITLNYVKNHDRNAKEFRRDIIEAIQRVPRKRPDKNSNIVNPLLAGGDNNNNMNGDKNNNNSTAEELAAQQAYAESNTFRCPKTATWTLPPSKFIDVVCGLDFATSSSNPHFTIGLEENASLFTPALLASGDQSSQQQGQNQIRQQPIKTNSTSIEFAEASKRIKYQIGTEAIAKINAQNKMAANTNNTNNNNQTPFGSVFQQLLSPSLDVAMMRSARLDTWLDGVPLSIPAPTGAMNMKKERIQEDDDEEQHGEKKKGNNNNNNLDEQLEEEEDSQQQHEEIQQQQQPLYFWPTSSSPEVNNMLMMQQQQQANQQSKSSSQALQQKEAEAFENLREALTECEASIPSFSENFFSSLADATTADSGTCGLISHAFDRGQGYVTRHRDAKVHGFSLINNNNSNTSGGKQPLQQQQKYGASSSLGSPFSGTLNNNKDSVNIANNNNIPMTGRKPQTSRTATPRLAISSLTNTQTRGGDRDAVENSTNLASPLGGTVNTNNNNSTVIPPQNDGGSKNINNGVKKSIVANSNATIFSASSALSPRNPFAPTTSSSSAGTYFHNPNNTTNFSNNTQSFGTAINTARMNNSMGGTAKSLASPHNTNANIINSSPAPHQNNNPNNNNMIMNQNQQGYNNNNGGVQSLLTRDAWNVSVPDSMCQSLSVFSDFVNGKNHKYGDKECGDHQLKHDQYFQRYEWNNRKNHHQESAKKNKNNRSNHNSDNDDDEQEESFVADGVTKDGFVYSSELLFGTEAQKYHLEVAKSLQRGRTN